MSVKPVVLRDQAHRDVAAAVAYYYREAGETIAIGFLDALQAVYVAIARRPSTGAPHYGQELNLPGLRTRPLRRYPHLVFYIEQPDRIDVWRVLHTARDIPASMQTPYP